MGVRSADYVVPAGSAVLACLLTGLMGSSSAFLAARSPSSVTGCPHEHRPVYLPESTICEVGRWRVVPGTIGATPEPVTTKYDPARDELTYSGWKELDDKVHRRHCHAVLASFHPFNEMVADTDGGRDVDDRGYVGFYAWRRKGPYGDLETKGWFGSDEHDDLNFVLELPDTHYLRGDTWTACRHRGIATIRQELEATTRNVDIGGGFFSSGRIAPWIRSTLTNHNVAGGDTKEADIQYNHEQNSALVLQFNLQGGYSTGPRGGGQVIGGVSAGTTITISTGYMSMQGRATLNKSGEAHSPAENLIQNKIVVKGATNDHVVGWELSTKTVEERLEIFEAE